jgi:hypothetical protein
MFVPINGTLVNIGYVAMNSTSPAVSLAHTPRMQYPHGFAKVGGVM